MPCLCLYCVGNVSSMIGSEMIGNIDMMVE